MDESGPFADGADPWGIETGFTDALGNRRNTSPEIRDALRGLMGPLPEGPPPVRPAPAEPAACLPPPSRRAWGWAVQLYSLRSARSWGLGDLADLRRLGSWSSNLGARFLQLNPLLAAQVEPPLEASPYYPGSRRFLHPIYLRIEEVAGAEGAGDALEPLAAAGRALNRSALIDRDAAFRLKRKALDLLWARFRGDAEFDRFRHEGGEGLAQFSAWCVLAEMHGSDWRRWPEGFRHPASPETARLAALHAERLAFHQWIQWNLDRQMAAAARAIPLVQDLPIGIDPGGADAWAWQDLLALDATVGAPPDAFNQQGQNWGLPPFIPHRLRASGYAPLRETLRASLRNAGGLRIDHVMGLFRLYWIPPGAAPTHGAYVRYPHREMLDILAEESRRAGAFIVGEDLGTVEPEVRRELARRRILGSKVLWFEEDTPASWPEGTLASLSTHDLPTAAGLWTGADAEELAALGFRANAEALQPLLLRIRSLSGLPARAEAREAVRGIHRILAGSNSSLIAAALEDALAVERRPNLPGTVAERPNWRIPLPIPLEEIEKDSLVLEVAAVLDRRP
jgi:4-alpha-glucanotransferase